MCSELQEVPDVVHEVVQEQEVQVCWCAGVVYEVH